MGQKAKGNMKVIHYTPGLRIGGIERYIETIIKNMKGYDFEIAYDVPSDEYIKDLTPHARFNQLKSKSISVPSRKIMRFLDPLNAYFRVANLRNYLRNEVFDLLHFHIMDLIPLLNGYPIYRETLIAVVSKTYRNICPRRRVLFTDHSMFLRFDTRPKEAMFYFDVFDNIICVHKIGYNHAVQECERKEVKKNLWYIPNSVDVNMFHPASDSKESNLRIGYAGRIAAEKGQEFLLKILPQLPEDIEFHIAYFTDNKIENRLREMAKVNPNIKLYKELSYQEMPSFYNSIDLLLNVTNPIANDRVVPEAMSCGRPVIMIGNVDRYPVVHGETGYLFDGRIESLLDQLHHIHDDRQNLERIGRNARRKIEEEYSNEVLMPKLREVYERLMR